METRGDVKLWDTCHRIAGGPTHDLSCWTSPCAAICSGSNRTVRYMWFITATWDMLLSPPVPICPHQKIGPHMDASHTHVGRVDMGNTPCDQVRKHQLCNEMYCEAFGVSFHGLMGMRYSIEIFLLKCLVVIVGVVCLSGSPT